MERKAQRTTTVLTTDARKVMRSTKVLTPEEEKVLRMRQGTAVDLHAPLPSAAEEEGEIRDELTLLELQLFRAQRKREGEHRSQAVTVPPAPRPTAPTSHRTKERIVRALRKKK